MTPGTMVTVTITGTIVIAWGLAIFTPLPIPRSPPSTLAADLHQPTVLMKGNTP